MARTELRSGRWLMLIAILSGIAACAPVSAPSSGRPGSAAAPAQAVPEAPPPAAPPPPFAVSDSLSAATPALPAAIIPPGMAGLWQSHSFTLDVGPARRAAAAWRTYRWCGPSIVAPCDEMRGSRISPGGRAALVLLDAGDAWIDADVVETTDPASLPVGAARLVLVRDGQLRLVHVASGTPMVYVSLCRPHTLPATACGA